MHLPQCELASWTSQLRPLLRRIGDGYQIPVASPALMVRSAVKVTKTRVRLFLSTEYDRMAWQHVLVSECQPIEAQSISHAAPALPAREAAD